MHGREHEEDCPWNGLSGGVSPQPGLSEAYRSRGVDQVLEGLEVVTSSLCPRGTAYVLADPPQPEAFDDVESYLQAAETWKRHGVYAIKGLP